MLPMVLFTLFLIMLPLLSSADASPDDLAARCFKACSCFPGAEGCCTFQFPDYITQAPAICNYIENVTNLGPGFGGHSSVLCRGHADGCPEEPKYGSLCNGNLVVPVFSEINLEDGSQGYDYYWTGRGGIEFSCPASTPEPAEASGAPTMIEQSAGEGQAARVCEAICRASYGHSRAGAVSHCKLGCAQSFQTLKEALDPYCRGFASSETHSAKLVEFRAGGDLDAATNEVELDQSSLLQLKHREASADTEIASISMDKGCRNICSGALRFKNDVKIKQVCLLSCLNPHSELSAQLRSYCLS